MKPGNCVNFYALILAMLCGLSATTHGAPINRNPAVDADGHGAANLSVEPSGPGSFTLKWTGAYQAEIFAATSTRGVVRNGKMVAASEVSPALISGLDPTFRWYFAVKTDRGPATIASTRQFALQGAPNVRDMGGFATDDGHVTAWGQVFRGGDLNKLTAADDRALATADVTVVVSYLASGEIALAGRDHLPSTTRLIHLPVLDPATQALATSLEDALKHGDNTLLQAKLGDGKAVKIGDEGFPNQLRNPTAMAAYGKTLRLIANSSGALLYHCSSGKDRTGMMSAFLLGVLGVPDDTIIKDFVASNTYNHEHNEQTYAFLRSKGINVNLVRPLMEQRASEIRSVLDQVHHKYGGWDNFAQTVLGLDAATLAKLRHKLLVH